MPFDAAGQLVDGAQCEVALRIGPAGEHVALGFFRGTDVAAAHAVVAHMARFDADLADAAAAASAADGDAFATQLFHAAEQGLVGLAVVLLTGVGDGY
ncbi:hypothetical protein APR50_42420 [Variovorax paradoxus]|nr:hypothetical protein APR50_42420 [Variovorax paradoxus]KPU90369.1 hypothetical protein APR52_35215 [Variovorax paradoxus]KPV05106.1 hypothetical protein APR49_22670 [Variovorax paradoxus]KPV09011.1 hypothetical protein APR51_42815 [Variovorax paradoxus]KPV17513.1 hypothetical protein APR48_41890 [Variovorax paradoxus]